MRRLRLLPVIGLSGLALLGAALPASAGAGRTQTPVPSNWVHHTKHPWAWFTPAHWVDSHGANDLNISSPTGALWAKFGFSGATYYASLTPTGNAVKWFHDLRANYRTGSLHSFGLYSVPLRSDRYTSVSKIHTISPPQGFSRAWTQSLTFTGVRHDGVPIKGVMVMEYAANPPAGYDIYGNAGENFRIDAAPRNGATSSLNTLRIVQQHITYCGSVC